VKALREEEKRGCFCSKEMVNQTSSIRFYPFSLNFHEVYDDVFCMELVFQDDSIYVKLVCLC
jgi:hypothetical protein